MDCRHACARETRGLTGQRLRYEHRSATETALPQIRKRLIGLAKWIDDGVGAYFGRPRDRKEFLGVVAGQVGDSRQFALPV